MSSADYLNSLSVDLARTALMKCCAANRWVDHVLNQRPFLNDEILLSVAEESANRLTRDDWLQAFAAHPRIGDVATLRAKFANTTEWASQEQAGVAAASDAVIGELARANDAYLERFGYLFIVCATGKSAPEMLDLLESRLANDPATELAVAAAEQWKITQLRLRKIKA